MELLSAVLGEMGSPVPEQGLAALRMWGQTGDRPTAWIAGADPVHLEPRMDSLWLHALLRETLSPIEMRPLIDHLQQELATDGGIGFARVGGCAYLSAHTPMSTATLPAYVIDRRDPGEYLPSGKGSADHRRLSSEIEMALHEHPTNLERLERGQQPVNGLWIWGGGFAPEQTTETIPPLYADEPLLTGHWLSKTAVAEMWPGSIDACIEQSVAGFVAVAPNYEDDDDVLESCLYELRLALSSRRLSKLILIFRDGVYADVRRSQSVRIWRRANPLLDGSQDGEI
jgi:hypothetical protein